RRGLGRRLRREAELGEEASGGFPSRSGLGPSHRATAALTRLEVRAEHMCEQPRPSVSPRRLLVFGLAEPRELELIAGRRWGPNGGEIGRRARHDFFAQTRVAREDPEIAQHVKMWRRDRGTKTHHEIFGRKHDRAGA